MHHAPRVRSPPILIVDGPHAAGDDCQRLLCGNDGAQDSMSSEAICCLGDPVMQVFTKAALEATGYLSRDGSPADGLILPHSEILSTSAGDSARLGPLLSTAGGGLGVDAVFRVGTSPVILFKSSEAPIEQEADWHRVAWNFGIAPLLWVTTPSYIKLYNAYQPPEEYGKRSPVLKEFPLGDALDHALKQVEAICGRRKVAMGSFWRSELARKIDRRHRVDNVLLSELGHLLTTLMKGGLRPQLAQKLVGRCIFFQYLLHRGYLTEGELLKHFGAPTLDSILTDLNSTYGVFRWIRSTFKGDLFPIEDEASERRQLADSAEPLQPLSDFFGSFSVKDGQGRLFPFRFDAIPVELISSIYEKFAHMSVAKGAPRMGIHYTPVNLVDLVLDPVFENASPDACVLDPACGSGVFLVESFRRLAWLRSQRETPSREMMNDILINQIRGIDVSPAALSVAGFSLYLALLELDPSPPSGIDALTCLRFEPLRNRVLFEASAFEPGLEDRLLPAVSRNRFDIIVGNPPWTYNPVEKEADRELARKVDVSESHEAWQSPSVEVKTEMSGTTFARLRRLRLPPRSTDWAFLWRCRDFGRADTKIALVMKATPFFSLALKACSARDAVLRAFPNVALVNLSQLRSSRLFQEYEEGDGNGHKKPKKRAGGPALLFLSNCLPANAGCVSVIGFPWSSTFSRTGVFEMPADPPKAVQVDGIRKLPGLLKAAAYGTDRDAWFLERLSRNSRVGSFKTWCERSGLPAGEGYQEGQAMKAAHLIGLPRAKAKDMRHGRLAENLPEFDNERVHRSREPSLFKGPLVLLPEGSLTNTPIAGRYTAAFYQRDIAYNSSFLGVSFLGRELVLPLALAAVMHSRLVAYQLALMGGTVGVKQTKIELIDLWNISFPAIEGFDSKDLKALSSAYEILTMNPQSTASREAAATIDHLVESAAGLSDSDRALLFDADRRTRAIFFETKAARQPMQVPPRESEIQLYAENLCATFNAFAPNPDDQVLIPDCYFELESDVVVVKFMLTAEREINPALLVNRGQLSDMTDVSLEPLGGTGLPFLKPAKALRLYVDRGVYMLKPAQYRYFSPAAGQSDADRIVSDLMTPDFPEGQTART